MEAACIKLFESNGECMIFGESLEKVYFCTISICIWRDM